MLPRYHFCPCSPIYIKNQRDVKCPSFITREKYASSRIYAFKCENPGVVVSGTMRSLSSHDKNDSKNTTNLRIWQMKNDSFAYFARAFFIFVHFACCFSSLMRTLRIDGCTLCSLRTYVFSFWRTICSSFMTDKLSEHLCFVFRLFISCSASTSISRLRNQGLCFLKHLWKTVFSQLVGKYSVDLSGGKDNSQKTKEIELEVAGSLIYFCLIALNEIGSFK